MVLGTDMLPGKASGPTPGLEAMAGLFLVGFSHDRVHLPSCLWVCLCDHAPNVLFDDVFSLTLWPVFQLWDACA